ncbi:hypothetical protein EDB84DRAFT_1564756 [Lactarius hengduanensis]|nr:hypothetical protein EDB84DRAFT_1572547 [Lactarius hengduanensis]KAH9023308.1 hypothetical protein EDB84DRAFT_1564756 [Lactarius hengduanensis]
MDKRGHVFVLEIYVLLYFELNGIFAVSIRFRVCKTRPAFVHDGQTRDVFVLEI